MKADGDNICVLDSWADFTRAFQPKSNATILLLQQPKTGCQMLGRKYGKCLSNYGKFLAKNVWKWQYFWQY